MASFLVTGSNRGIGLEYCRQLQQLGNRVIAVCRTASPELEALAHPDSALDLRLSWRPEWT